MESAQYTDNQVRTCFGHDARMLSEGMEYVTLLTKAKGLCPPMQRKHLSEFLVGQYNLTDDLLESRILIAKSQPEVTLQAVSTLAQNNDTELLFRLMNDPTILEALTKRGNPKKDVSIDKIRKELKNKLEGEKYDKFKIELKNLSNRNTLSGLFRAAILAEVASQKVLDALTAAGYSYLVSSYIYVHAPPVTDSPDVQRHATINTRGSGSSRNTLDNRSIQSSNSQVSLLSSHSHYRADTSQRFERFSDYRHSLSAKSSFRHSLQLDRSSSFKEESETPHHSETNDTEARYRVTLSSFEPLKTPIPVLPTQVPEPEPKPADKKHTVTKSSTLPDRSCYDRVAPRYGPMPPLLSKLTGPLSPEDHHDTVSHELETILDQLHPITFIGGNNMTSSYGAASRTVASNSLESSKQQTTAYTPKHSSPKTTVPIRSDKTSLSTTKPAATYAHEATNNGLKKKAAEEACPSPNQMNTLTSGRTSGLAGESSPECPLTEKPASLRLKAPRSQPESVIIKGPLPPHYDRYHQEQDDLPAMKPFLNPKQGSAYKDNIAGSQRGHEWRKTLPM